MRDETPFYDVYDWHWSIDGDLSQFWSSKAGAYVKKVPKGLGISNIASEQELMDVLAQYGLPGPLARRRRARRKRCAATWSGCRAC